jgi:hypothetical protein
MPGSAEYLNENWPFETTAFVSTTGMGLMMLTVTTGDVAEIPAAVATAVRL